MLEPGPGMGFFTLPLARIVGPAGRIVAVDIQPRMLEGLRGRARNAGLLERIDLRLAQPGTMGTGDLKGTIDFVLAFAVVHEMTSAEAFFREAAEVLRPGGLLLLAEPAGHVKPERFKQELTAAEAAGLAATHFPVIRSSLAALLQRI